MMAPVLDSVGTIANVQWCAISHAHLRKHPLYRPLPLPCEVEPVSLQMCSLFRQDTWQWGELHKGRLTTSRLSCCVGFFEPITSGYLKIPRSLQSHQRVVTVWQQLIQKPVSDLRTLADTQETTFPRPTDIYPMWTPAVVEGMGRPLFPFEYCPPPIDCSPEEGQELHANAASARLAWGSAQEATAVLAVLNHFAATERGTTVHEAGMLPLEALDESAAHRHFIDQEAALRDILRTATLRLDQKGSAGSCPDSSVYETVRNWIHRDRTMPLLGASPDGVIAHADGSIEVLEVKCVSPFVDVTVGKDPGEDGIGGTHHRAMRVVGGFPQAHSGGSSINAGFGVWHVPQLMMEMFCAGAHCRSAVVAILSVTGARLYRLHRDDEYIAVMLDFVRQFYTRYISSVPSNKRKPPPPDFFNPRINRQYAVFLQRTVALAEGAQLLVELRGDEIQRNHLNTEFFL